MPTGTVKFFNPIKGFGFITPDDRDHRQKDVWVGMAAVRLAGLDALEEGQKVEYETETDGLNRINATSIQVIAQVSRQSGAVKWFRPTMGYGFIVPSGGGSDVFVHISAVRRSGYMELLEGQHVEYKLVTNRGKQAAEDLQVKS